MLPLRLALCFFSLQLAACTVYYKTTKLECIENPAYLRNISCKLKAVNRYKAVANMAGVLVKPLRNISARLQVLQKNSANIYNPFIIDFTVNMCDVMDKKKYPAYAMILWGILRRYSNLNHSCPYEGRLFAQGLYVDEVYSPITLPLGSYKLNSRYMEGYPYEHIGSSSFYFDAIEPTKKSWKQKNNL